MKSFCTRVVTGALLLASPIICFSETVVDGDFVVAPGDEEAGSIWVAGDLHVSGNAADFGTTTENKAALLLSYHENGDVRQVVVYASQDAIEYLWKEGSDNVTQTFPKMSLGADNTLTLYNERGLATISLSPVSGEISTYSGIRLGDGTLLDSKKALRSSALYTASGQVVAEVGEDGSITFKNGVVFGAGGSVKLTEGSVAYLQDVLGKLGYQENPVDVTEVPMFFGNSYNTAFKVSSDLSGNRMIAGTFSGSSLKLGAVNLWGSDQLNNHFVAKFSEDGKAVWSKVWDVNGSLNSTHTDASGNVYVAGRFTTTNSKTYIAGVLVAVDEGASGYVVKFNSAGATQWVKLIGGKSLMAFERITTDASGNIYLCGQYSVNIGTAVDLAGVMVAGQGSYDGFALKLNSTGESLWAKTFGSTGTDYANAMAVDSVGNIYVGGFFNQAAGKNVDLAGISVKALGSNDGYIVKLNSAGTAQWAKVLGGTSSDQVTAIALDSADALYIAGNINGTAGKTLSLAGKSVKLAGNTDGYLLKLGSDGTAQWATVLGSTDSDSITGISIDHNDAVYLTGYVSGAAGQSVSMAGLSLLLENAGNTHYALSLNNTGAGKWVRAIPGTLNGVHATAQDSLLLTGISGNQRMVLGDSLIPGGWISYVAEIPSDNTLVDSVATARAGFSWGNSTSSGESSVAIGDGAYAYGNNSISLGMNTYATGDLSTAIGGEYNNASGSHAVVIGGSGSRATATASFVAGGESNGSYGGNSAVIGGWWNYANGSGSFVAAGSGNVAQASYSAVVGGSNNFVGGYNSFIGGGESGNALGHHSTILGGALNTTSGSYTVATGFYSAAHAAYSVVIGSSNAHQGDKTTWVPTDDLFVIGNGDPDQWGGDRSNALAVHKNGEMRSGGAIQARGGVRVPPGSDIPMGPFATGNNPAELNAGLRYEGE